MRKCENVGVGVTVNWKSSVFSTHETDINNKSWNAKLIFATFCHFDMKYNIFTKQILIASKPSKFCGLFSRNVRVKLLE